MLPPMVQIQIHLSTLALRAKILFPETEKDGKYILFPFNKLLEKIRQRRLHLPTASKIP